MRLTLTGDYMLKTGVSYYGNRMPWHVKKDLEDIKKHNCDFVLHTFNEEDMEFYFGTMQQIVSMSHAAGLEVHLDPWGVGKVFGGECYSEFIVKNLGVLQYSSTDEPLPIACPNNEKFVEFMHYWIIKAKELGADYVFWDEPHFYVYIQEGFTKAFACRCKVCQALFKKEFGAEMPRALTDEVRLFKENSLARFIERLCDFAQSKGLKNSFCFFHFDNSSTFKDWSKIARIKSLDIIGTDPYWRIHQTPEEAAEKTRFFSQKIVSLAHQYKKEPQIWILNFSIPKAQEHYIDIAIDVARTCGITNFAAWCYRGAEHVWSLKSEDPLAVWNRLGEAYKKLKEEPQ